MENIENFIERVFQRTGTSFEDMLEVAVSELNSAHIVCRRGGTFVVFVGYPETDNEGNEFWPPCAARVINTTPPEGHIPNERLGEEHPFYGRTPTEQEAQAHWASVLLC